MSVSFFLTMSLERSLFYQIVISRNPVNPSDTNLMQPTEKIFCYVNGAFEF